MAEFTSNAQANVSAGKGVKGGYCFRAPVGTTLPSDDISWTPDTSWDCMGFIPEDGVTFSTEAETQDFLDMNGDTMDSSQSSYSETFQCQFAETKKATFESIYGADAVTDSNGVLTVNHTGAEPGEYSYVFLFELKNGRKWLRFAEKCKRTELEDVQVNSSTVTSWGGTYKAFYSETTGGYFKDLLESTETDSSSSH